MIDFTFVYMGRVAHSYGYSGLKLAAELQKLGVETVDIMPAASQVENGDEWQGPPWRIEGAVVALLMPEWLPHIEADALAVFTMFEGFGLPRERVALVNEHADWCVVPSTWCLEGFQESGVEVPIFQVPLGVCPGDYPYLERGDRPGPYRFLWNGFHDGRKGWDVVYKAFWQAFRGSDEVELMLHFREYRLTEPHFADGNVVEMVGYQSQPIIRRMLHSADCYVYPARGEGWGLPPREAAATGLVVLASDYAGLAEDIEEWALPVRMCKEQKTRFTGFESEQFLIGEPCPNDLADLMRFCFENQAEARERGRRASEWLVGNQTWAHVAQRLWEVATC